MDSCADNKQEMEEVTNNNQSVEEGSFELKKLSKSRDSNARSRISLLSKEYLFKHNIRDIRSKRVNLSPLHEAINRGDMKAVKQMMETVKRRYLNTVDAHGMTCLHYASKHGHTDIALLLLDNGASINFTTRQGGALQTAIRYMFHILLLRIILSAITRYNLKINSLSRYNDIKIGVP